MRFMLLIQVISLLGCEPGSPLALSPQVYLLWQSPVLLNTYCLLSLFQVANRTASSSMESGDCAGIVIVRKDV